MSTIDYLNSKDALFALDTTFEEDIVSYKDDVTRIVIKYINSTPELYKRVKSINSIETECTLWAEEHNNEFGDLFISELDVVHWNKVGEMI